MKKIFAVAVVLFLAASLALAASDENSRLDKNKDGKISKQEFQDAAREKFDELDKNKDGVLTRDEIGQDDKIDPAKFIAETDLDNDGRILKREFEQAAEKRFSTLDKNKDGAISKKEWYNARNNKDPMLVLFRF